MNTLYEILEILMKYSTADYVWTEHDIIGFSIDEEIISEDDLKQLKELGVFYSEDYECLAYFV